MLLVYSTEKKNVRVLNTTLILGEGGGSTQGVRIDMSTMQKGVFFKSV